MVFFSLIGITNDRVFTDCEEINKHNDFPINIIKPYLRPMSSMTEEEKEIYRHYKHDIMYEGSGSINFYMSDYIDWLNKHHFDWRDNGNNQTLIEAGLALEAPEGMYKID